MKNKSFDFWRKWKDSLLENQGIFVLQAALSENNEVLNKKETKSITQGFGT